MEYGLLNVCLFHSTMFYTCVTPDLWSNLILGIEYKRRAQVIKSLDLAEVAHFGTCSFTRKCANGYKTKDHSMNQVSLKLQILNCYENIDTIS